MFTVLSFLRFAMGLLFFSFLWWGRQWASIQIQQPQPVPLQLSSECVCMCCCHLLCAPVIENLNWTAKICHLIRSWVLRGKYIYIAWTILDSMCSLSLSHTQFCNYADGYQKMHWEHSGDFLLVICPPLLRKFIDTSLYALGNNWPTYLPY